MEDDLIVIYLEVASNVLSNNSYIGVIKSHLPKFYIIEYNWNYILQCSI